MILSRYTLKNINPELVKVPDESVFALPEKVLQFGTGVSLRGLPDYFIDKANRQGIFNGRIVAVNLKNQVDASVFDKQDGLYTHCILDVKDGEKTKETIINSSISRIMVAAQQWNEILDCAHGRDLRIIISNAGEVSIQLVPEDIRHHPPKSYPGKLLSFLYERFHAFGGSAHSGMVIIATELVSNNGKKLESIILELAHLNGLEEEFIEWIENHNSFCNSMADRIVPCELEVDFLSGIKAELGYDDHLLVISEDYGLWAIEAERPLEEVLSFAEADGRVLIKPGIKVYDEIKIHLLNATHTLGCAVAFFYGCQTVDEAMGDKTISSFLVNLMREEVESANSPEVDVAALEDLGLSVLRRFKNPYIKHLWLNIAIDYSAKMKVRCVPIIVKHFEKSEAAPQAMALGFAAYIYFMKAVTGKGDIYYGEFKGETYEIQDEKAEVFYKRWTGLSVASLVQVVLSDPFWGVDLLSLPGLKQAIIEKLNLIINNGMREAIDSIPLKKVEAA